MYEKTYKQLCNLIALIESQAEQTHMNRSDIPAEHSLQYAEFTGNKEALMFVLVELIDLQNSFLLEKEELMRNDKLLLEKPRKFRIVKNVIESKGE